jgi:hypothetical protein
MKRPLKVDLVSLEIGFENSGPELSYYFDRETGDVILVTDELRSAFERISEDAESEGVEFGTALAKSDLPEWDKQAMTDVAAVEERLGSAIVAIPEPDSREAFRDMEAFAASPPNALISKRLLDALSGARPFRRFKDALGVYPQEREAWFAFRDNRLRQRVLQWLADEGIELID